MKDSITTTPLPLNPRLVHLSLTINTSALWSTDRYLWLASFHLSNSCHIIIVVPQWRRRSRRWWWWWMLLRAASGIFKFDYWLRRSLISAGIHPGQLYPSYSPIPNTPPPPPACHLIQFFNKFSPFAEYFILSADPNIYPPARSRAAAPLITLSSDSQSVRRPDQDSTFHGRIRYRQAETWQMDGPRMGRGRGLSLWITF